MPEIITQLFEIIIETDIRILAGAGIALIIFGFLLIRYLSRRRKKKLRDEILFGLYLSLMEAYGYYYWVVMGSIKADDPVILEKTRTLKNMINNQSEQLKSMKVYRDISAMLNEELILPRDIYKAYGDALERLGGFISSYCPIISKRITDMGFDANNIVNAPGFLDWAPKQKKQWK